MVDWMNFAPLVLAAAMLVPAVVSDVREQRIPNRLCFAGFLSALVLHGVLAGWAGFFMALAAGWFLLLITFPLFAFGWLGAGDVKLLAATGATAGTLPVAVATLVAIAIAGGLLVFLVIFRNRSSRRPDRHGAGASPASRRPAGTQAQAHTGESQEVPYAVAIAAGTLVVFAALAFAGN